MEDSRLEHENISYVRVQINRREEIWLEKSGWTHTSSTPGCYWMWMKEWDGKTLMVGQDTAARIQSIWDAEADERLHPEDIED